MTFDDINATNFVDARSFEIQKLEAELQTSRKKTMLFQRLPFHKRRRTRDKHVNKRRFSRRRNTRQREKLVYYHKRFEMINLLGVYLPLQRREKSDSFIYKSEHRGYAWIEHYKKAFVYEKSTETQSLNALESVEIDLTEGSKLLETQINELKDDCMTVITDNEQYEVYKHGTFIVVISIGSPRFSGYRFVKELGVPISLMKGVNSFMCDIENMFTSFLNNAQVITLQLEKPDDIGELQVYDNLDPETLNINVQGASISTLSKERLKYKKEDEIVTFTNVLVIPRMDSIERYKFIVSKDLLRELHDFIVKAGIVPVSLSELFRIGLEHKELIYPFDCPSSPLFRIYEKVAYSPEMEKWRRTPPGKRINYEKFGSNDPWFLPSNFYDNFLCTAYFEVPKGSAKRMGLVYEGDCIVGYVLRASYCYKIGKCRGVCVLRRGVEGDYKIRNTNSKDFMEMNIV